MNLNDDVIYCCARLGRSTSVISAVPAPWSATAIAFIGILSSVRHPELSHRGVQRKYNFHSGGECQYSG